MCGSLFVWVFCSPIRYDPVWTIIVLSHSLPVWSGLIILTPCCHHFCPVHYSVEFSALASGMFRYVRLLFQVEQAFLLVGFFSLIPKKIYKVWSKKTHGKLKKTPGYFINRRTVNTIICDLISEYISWFLYYSNVKPYR